MMMKLYIALLAALLLLLSGCGNKPKPGEDDTLTSGTITIAVDETFRPIIEEELQVFHALTPDATVHPIYCSEVEAMKLLLADSVRLAITTRQLTTQETAYLNDKKFFPVSVKMATDGLALIVNKQNTDSLITVDQFKEILTGKVTDWKQLNPASRLGELQLVFDNPNSSTVHYVLDSICGGMPLSKDLKAQKTNPEVISYVAKNPAALGVIGVNWIGNPADSTRLSFNDAIRIMAVSRADSATVGNSFTPYPGLHDTHEPHQHARRAAAGLHPHRPLQGRLPRPGAEPPRPAQQPRAGHHPGGHQLRRLHGRGHRHGDHLHHPRPRLPAHKRGQEPGRARRHGHGHPRRRHRGPHKPRRGPHLREGGPAHRPGSLRGVSG